MSVLGASKIKSVVGINMTPGYLLPFVFLIAACSSSEAEVWQGGDVLIDAKQEVLEREVETVSDQHKELVEKFVELERLYISLAARIEAQEQTFKKAEANGTVSATDLMALQNIVNKSQSDISDIASNIKGLENRVYTVEIASAVSAGPAPLVPTTDASTDEESDDPTNGETAEAVSSDSRSIDNVSVFGIHLASYRSQDQVSGGWASILSAYSELEGTTPLIFTQSQEGVGDFLRLITGPYSSEQLAEQACERIKQVSSEQYCRVSTYEGNTLDG